VASRIREVYGIEAEVVHPPVSVDTEGVRESVAGLDAGFFLTVARPRGYKGTTVLRDAFARVPGERLVVVGAEVPHPVPANVTVLGFVSEEQLRWLYANARALVSVSHEDFGLTPVEANAFGTPALVLRAGGFLDSTAEGVSGSFIADDTVPAVVEAVSDFEDDFDRAAILRHATRFSPAAFGARMREIAGV
jgi:glycosyltransferase involved in cell wall biosynthesis